MSKSNTTSEADSIYKNVISKEFEDLKFRIMQTVSGYRSDFAIAALRSATDEVLYFENDERAKSRTNGKAHD